MLSSQSEASTPAGPCIGVLAVNGRMRGMRLRSIGLSVGVALVVVACGGNELSLTEYVDRLNAVGAEASARGEALADRAAQTIDFTPQDLQAILEQAGEIRIDVEEAVEDIEPPEQIADLHEEIFDWHARFITVESDLATRAGMAEDTDADWTALSDSPEMAAYRTAIAEGKQICDEFQGKLDATAERGTFSDVPWLPNQMTEVVEAVLGCAWFPDNPEDVYRWPPP